MRVVFFYNVYVASAGRRFRRKTITVRLKAHRNREAGWQRFLRKLPVSPLFYAPEKPPSTHISNLLPNFALALVKSRIHTKVSYKGYHSVVIGLFGNALSRRNIYRKTLTFLRRNCLTACLCLVRTLTGVLSVGVRILSPRRQDERTTGDVCGKSEESGCS